MVIEINGTKIKFDIFTGIYACLVYISICHTLTVYSTDGIISTVALIYKNVYFVGHNYYNIVMLG